MINSALTENNLDVEVVKKIVELRRKINSFANPIFKEKGVPVMTHWDDFAYSGLCATDYVTCKCYIDGEYTSHTIGDNEGTTKSNNMSQLEVLELLSKIEDSLVEDDLDVEVVEKVVELRKTINGYKSPIFKENGVPVMTHWDEFHAIGLCNTDYVTTCFYKTGFNEE